MKQSKLSKGTKSTIKLIAAIVIIMFVFKVLVDEPENYTDEEIKAAFSKTIKVSDTEDIDINAEESEENKEEIDELEKVDEFAEYRAKKVELSAGYHNVGRDGDINPGTYKVYAKSGYGLITGDIWQGYISETVGYNRSTCVTERIDRIFLTKEDSFKIEGRCELVFEPIE